MIVKGILLTEVDFKQIVSCLIVSEINIIHQKNQSLVFEQIGLAKKILAAAEKRSRLTTVEKVNGTIGSSSDGPKCA